MSDWRETSLEIKVVDLFVTLVFIVPLVLLFLPIGLACDFFRERRAKQLRAEIAEADRVRGQLAALETGRVPLREPLNNGEQG